MALIDIGAPQHFQIARLCLHPKGLYPYIVDWQSLATVGLVWACHRVTSGSRLRTYTNY